MDGEPLTDREKEEIFNRRCPDCGSELTCKFGDVEVEHIGICQYEQCSSLFAIVRHNHRHYRPMGRLRHPKDATLSAIKLAQSWGTEHPALQLEL